MRKHQHPPVGGIFRDKNGTFQVTASGGGLVSTSEPKTYSVLAFTRRAKLAALMEVGKIKKGATVSDGPGVVGRVEELHWDGYTAQWLHNQEVGFRQYP
jgi:hypothetical protein